MQRKKKKTPIFPALYEQIFTIEDIAEETGTPISTLRTWQGNRSVNAQKSFTPGSSAGRGTKAKYAVIDAMQFMLIARIAKDTMSIKSITECCRSEVLDLILDRLSEIADGLWHGSNYSTTNRKNSYERYAFIYEYKGELYMTQDWLEWHKDGGCSCHVIDVIHMAHRVYSLWAKKMGLVGPV